jgi:FkbM family methyltransferase
VRLSDLTYWPRQHTVGFFRLWQFNGPGRAVSLTVYNLLRVRRLFEVRLYGFAVTLRSGTPDLAVALDSLEREFESVTGFADAGGLIIDAGGYIGTAALRLAAAYPASRVICLEPSAENLEILRRNVGAVQNIAVIAAALAARSGEAMLHDAGNGEWGFSTVAEGIGERRALGVVPAVTIESLMADEGAERLFLLKLDVEGAEGDILAASGGWMPNTDILVAELHDHLVPGAEAAFAAATAGRDNRRLPGEKVVSLRAGFSH